MIKISITKCWSASSYPRFTWCPEVLDLHYIHLVMHLREGNDTHSSTLAWKIPWTEEPGRLQSMGSPRVGHDWATSPSLFTFMHWRRKWQPTPLFLPGESQGGGAWWTAVYGVAQSQTRLKRLSSSSHSPWGKTNQISWTRSQALMGKHFMCYAFYHLYPTVTQALHMCF